MASIRSIIPRSALPRRSVLRSKRWTASFTTVASDQIIPSSSLSSNSSPVRDIRSRSSLADLSISPSKRTGGVSRLHVSVVMGIPTVVHTLAVVRAIEEKFGRILDIQQMRHSDIPVSKNYFFVELLNPIPQSTFSSGDINLELPIPSSYHSMPSLLGGPSLSDIDSVLYGDITPLPTSRTLRNHHTEMMLVSIQAASDRRVDSSQYISRMRPRRRRIPARQAEEEKEEDQAIASALSGFSGFYGGFEPLRRQYRRLAQGDVHQAREVEPVAEEEVEEVEEAAIPASLVEAWKERKAHLAAQPKKQLEENIEPEPVDEPTLANDKTEHNNHSSRQSSTPATSTSTTPMTTKHETSPLSSITSTGNKRFVTPQRQEWYNRAVERERQRIQETERRAVEARPSLFSRSKPKPKKVKAEDVAEGDKGLLTGLKSWLGGSGLKKH